MILFYQLFSIFQKRFSEVEERLRQGTLMNLNDARPGEKVSKLLHTGFYFRDSLDIALIAKTVDAGKRPDKNINNTGELNKKNYFINADNAFNTGGESFKKRVNLSRSLIGFSNNDSSLYAAEIKSPLKVTSTTDAQVGMNKISGHIFSGSTPCMGVLVRIKLNLPPTDTSGIDIDAITKTEYQDGVRKVFSVDTGGHKILLTFSAYARTDERGEYTFAGLPNGRSYEILPLHPGYQYGNPKGTTELTGDLNFNFNQSPHTIRLFSAGDFSVLKKERAFIVRTPAEAILWYWIIVAGFLISFLLLHIFLSILFPHADQFLLPVLMVLTGFSFITLLSLQDPLRDRFLAKSTLYYFGTGVLGIIILMLFNMKYFTNDSWLYRLFIFKKNNRAANGWPWAVGAMSLLGLTILMGTGPEGSGVKVNLFGFQPSEIVKFLIIFFLAGFFAVNEKFIAEYTSWKKRFSFFFFVLLAILSTIFLFLILGDLGPAIVCCFTFIILFSFSRGDFIYMAGSVLLYIFSIWITKNVWYGTAITWLVLLFYMLIKRKQLSESAMMALVVIAGFLLLDQVPYMHKFFPGPIDRLVQRKAIWENPWNNEVFGGDQVANGIWAMAGGGVKGQGIGEGFAKTIPESHTDMILPSIGEEFGLAGILCIFVLFLILLHRSIIIGRQTGRPFLFYASAGIGIGTFVQFLLIAGGSTGALPLSGVALPFLSYGGSSLLCNMLGVGFLLSASNIQGSAVQMNYMARQQDKNLLPALLAACAGIVLLSITVSHYIINNRKWVVEPALVADRSGGRMFSYNPRINILMNKLQAGNLLDRHGNILATSHLESIKLQQDSLLSAGVVADDLEAMAYKRLNRYYPFANQLFFWTGDANSGIFNGSTNGYFAEYEMAPELRGFPTPSSNLQVIATRYKPRPFQHGMTTEMTVSKRNYDALADLLIKGVNSLDVEKFKQKNRDVQLTIDAGLQAGIQHSISLDDSVNTKRVSVVIMEDNTGDVLSSVTWPLPTLTDPEKLMLNESELNKLSGWSVTSDIGFTLATQPGSTAKLVTALAAFNKLGEHVANEVIVVHPWDLIRTKGLEPDEPGNITIERAIIKSNNSFFIKLANQEKLQEEMGTLYLQSGLFLHGVGGYFYETGNNPDQQERWRELWRNTEFRSVKYYNNNDIRRTRGRGVSGMAWGQGELVATPAAIARIACGIANHGNMFPNRFVSSISGVTTALKEIVPIAKNKRYSELITGYMRKQSAPKFGKLGIYVAGKTGTPERIWKGEKINDGWYVFFAPKPDGTGNIITCVRIENATGSSEAVKLAGKHVIPLLLKKGYIRSFSSFQKSESLHDSL